MSWQNWQTPSELPRPRFHYASLTQAPPPKLQPDQPLLPRNEVELSREMLMTVLTHLSTLIPAQFNGHPVRLVVHGGACMLLHPGLYSLSQEHRQTTSDGMTLARRTTTRDVDYINRSFAAEWHRLGLSDATERLQRSIKVTARQFGLGADWMNSDADVALPMAQGPNGTPYDPIYTDSIRPNNIDLHTIFTSPNSQLTLVSVTPFWAVALKLVRYTRWDPGDICLLLRNGTALSGTQWTPAILEGWLIEQCWAMGYAGYDAKKVEEMRARILHAVKMVLEVQSAEAMGMGAMAGTRVGVGASMGGGEKGERGNMTGAGWTAPPGIKGSEDWINKASIGDSAADMAGGGTGVWADPSSLGGPHYSSPPIADVGSAGGWVNPAFFDGHVPNADHHHPPDSFADATMAPSSWVGAGRMAAGHGFGSGPGHELHRNSSVEKFDRSISSILHSSSSPVLDELPPRRRSRHKKHSYEDDESDHSSPYGSDDSGWNPFAHSHPLTPSNLQHLQHSLSSPQSHHLPQSSPHPQHQLFIPPPQPHHQQHTNSLGLY